MEQMKMEPMNAWAIVRDGKVVYVRLDKGMANACANIEGYVYGEDKVKIVPILMTEVVE